MYKINLKGNLKVISRIRVKTKLFNKKNRGHRLVKELIMKEMKYRSRLVRELIMKEMKYRRLYLVFIFFLLLFQIPAYSESQIVSAGLVTISKTKIPPTIDGEIKPEEWKYASVVSGFMDLTGSLTKDDTIFYITYDQQNLYFAFKSTVQGKPISAHTKRDDSLIVSDDAVEIFLQPDPQKLNSYYQFVGNSIGAVVDFKNCKRSWNGNWIFKNKIVDSGKMAGGVLTFEESIWTGEIAIAFKDLGVSCPKDGNIWKINFCRDWGIERNDKNHRHSRWTSWALASKFNDPKIFGSLCFKKESPVVKVFNFGELFAGDIEVNGSIFNPISRCSNLQAALSVYLAKSNKKLTRKEITLSVKQGKEKPLKELKQVLGLTKSYPVRLEFLVKNKGGKTPIYKKHLNFTIQPSFKVNTALYYSQNILEISYDIHKLKLPSAFSVSSKIYRKNDNNCYSTMNIESLNNKTKTTVYKLNLGKYPPGKYIIKSYITQGKHIIAQQNADFIVPEKPEWLGNKLGISDKVPIPWKPVKVKGNSVFVLGREYQFDNYPLPCQIINKGKPFLVSPIEFKIVTDKGVVEWQENKLSYISQSDTKVKLKSINKNSFWEMSSEIEIEFDGFVRVDLTLTPRKPINIKNIFLKIPLKKDDALYLKGLTIGTYYSDWYAAALYPDAEGGTFNIQNMWFLSSTGWLWADKFLHYFWVGGDERGISITFNSDQNFHTKKYLEIIDKKNGKDIVYNFIGTSYLLKRPLSYTFALHATPVKPLPKDPKKWHYGFLAGNEIKPELEFACCYGGLTKGPGWPELTTRGAKRIKQLKKSGIKASPDYYTALTTVEMPEFQLFGKEWESIPFKSWRWGGNVSCVLVCTKKPYADYLIWGLNKLIDNGIGGIYFDVSGPRACTNQHHGCGYIDETGKRKPTISLFEVREVYKRIYTLFKSRNPDSFIFHHAVPISPLASFVDGTTEAEEWAPGRASFDDLKPDFVRFGFAMYHQYGIPYTFYPALASYGHPSEQIPLKYLYPFTLIYNVYPNARTANEKLKLIWDIMDPWYTSSKWLPYWRNGHLVKSFSKKVKVSLYLKEKKVLVLVVNQGKKTVSGKLKINSAKLGFDKNNVKIIKLPEDKEVSFANSQLSVTLPKYGIQFFQITEKRKEK